MPFIAPFVKKASKEAVLQAVDGDEGRLERDLELIVARAFYYYAREDMQVGTEVQAFPTKFVSSIPVDLGVVVMCWWTEQRAKHFADIGQYVAENLRLWYMQVGSISWDVKLAPLGGPAGRYNWLLQEESS